jgi:hypothetical protein
VSHPSAGSQVIIANAQTRALAAETSGRPPDFIVDAATTPTREQIQAVLDSAGPGDIVEFRGSHVLDTLYLRSDGTPDNPIYVRGDGTAIVGDPAGGEVFIAVGNHWVVEDLTINSNMDANWGVRVDGRQDGSSSSRKPVTGFTLRRTVVRSRKGLKAAEGSVGEIYDVTVYDNVFVGRWSWSDVVTLAKGGQANGGTELRSTWNDVGIKLTGQGHSVFNNTLSGFGDGIKTDRYTSISNINILYSRNDLLWGRDDGIELDDGYRNCAAIENRISNSGTGISKQPNFVTGGPTYAVRNVLVNQFLRPFKLNDGPNGLIVAHNTIVGSQRTRPDYFWLQFNNGQVENISVLNNLLVWANPPAPGYMMFFDTLIAAEQWDGNAYWPDAGFKFRNVPTAPSFAAAQADSRLPAGYAGAGFEASGALLPAQPFDAGIAALGANWETYVEAFDPRLSAVTPGRSAAIPLRGFGGSSRGAVEVGTLLPKYGARSIANTVAPAPPEALTVQ